MTVLEAAVMPKKLLVKEWDESVSLSLENGCPKLKDDRCTIYENRPSACRKYPFYNFGKNVMVGKCLAVAKGLVNDKIQAIENAGFIVMDTNAT